MAGVSENARIIVQSDWDQCLRATDATVWVSFRRPGEQSVHGELTSHGVSSSGDPYVSASPGFKVDRVSRRRIVLTYEGVIGCQCSFQPPLVTYTSLHRSRKVQCLDVSSGGLGVSSDTAGKTLVWSVNSGEIRRELVGHYGDVYSCKFFPSGIVILTGGADMQLKIWSAETGQCAATLTGHRAGVLDAAIVDRGRNIVSCSRDGTVKLWDCGTQTCLGTIDDMGGIVNGCCVGQACSDLPLGTPQQPTSDKECMTEGKVLLAACENGMLKGYGLHSRLQVFGAQCESAVNCCAFVSSTTAACGTQDGHFYLWDIRNSSTPLHHAKESRGALLSLLPFQQGCFATAGDGSCFLVNELHQTSLELTGSDCDPIYKAVSDGTNIYTACRDGCIRKYHVA